MRDLERIDLRALKGDHRAIQLAIDVIGEASRAELHRSALAPLLGDAHLVNPSILQHAEQSQRGRENRGENEEPAVRHGGESSIAISS